MENINSLIEKAKAPQIACRRLEYSPYSIKIAGMAMLKIIQGIEPDYKNIYKGIIRNLIMYAQGDSKSIYDLDKAIGIIGPTGTGKTLTFKALSEFMKIDDIKFVRNGNISKFGFDVVSARFLASQFVAKGFDGVNPYIIRPVLCIDDLGAEPENITHFGNKLNLIQHIIEERYMNNRITHFSSNNTMDKIHEIYGDRVYSRLYGSINIIQLVCEDWRLKSHMY